MRIQLVRPVQLLVLASLAMLMAGCATLLPRAVLPERLVDEAELAGMPGVRIWGDASAEEIKSVVEAAISRSRETPEVEILPISNMLAISGGAEDGAFGAGLLVGWTAEGTRPQFDLVTGVSAGGLIAPFAFLGPQRDAQLKEIFTRYGQSDILTTNVLSGLFGGPALADSTPLANLIAKYVDRRFLREVAGERRKGRILLIGTTNLDAQRPVLWDMGRIAMSEHPNALQLFRKILLASASIPGVFPPVRIQVRAGGHLYEEVHVDGGVTQQVFLAPYALAFSEIDHARGVRVSRQLFVIRNAKINPEWKPVDERTLSLAQRSMSTLIKYQSAGDLSRMYARARRDDIDFHLAAIPADFHVESRAPFDQSYMRALYDVGYRQGRDGYRWLNAPPP